VTFVIGQLQFDLDGLVRTGGARQQDRGVRSVVFFMVAGRAARSRVVAGELPILVAERGRRQILAWIRIGGGAGGKDEVSQVAEFRHGGEVE
jgi:hypothetical protein